jgi:hypothetical protein
LPVALAATVFLAVMLTSRGPEVGVAPVATVALIEDKAGTPAGGPSVGDDIYAGDDVATGEFGLALTVNNGLSLRLAAGSTVTFDSMEDVTLRSGRIYADSGESVYDNRSITVHTPVGSARDIGTRFAVSFLDGDMSVAVREGKVDVSHSLGSYTAQAGEMLRLQPGEDILVDRISIYDSSWDWAAALAPAFDIENHTLLDFLKWAARETGKELVFDNDATRFAAMGIRYRGSIAGFTPIEALGSVLATTHLEHRVDSQQIVISDPAR